MRIYTKLLKRTLAQNVNFQTDPQTRKGATDTTQIMKGARSLFVQRRISCLYYRLVRGFGLQDQTFLALRFRGGPGVENRTRLNVSPENKI